MPASEAAPGAYLVVLKNDFGGDFLANDLPEDRVATRPRGLSLGDLICLRGLAPARLPGAQLGRREELGAADGGSARPGCARTAARRPAASAPAHRRPAGGRVGAGAEPPRPSLGEVLDPGLQEPGETVFFILFLN